jgi:hypothetical protein
LSFSARSTNAIIVTDVLAEICERERGIRQDARVVPCHFQSPPG